MKICLIITDYYPNLAGAEIFAKNIAEKLVALGHSVFVITAKKKDLKNYEKINGVEIFRVHTPIFPYGFIISGFLKAVKLKITKKIDVFHSILAHYPGLIGLLLKIFFRQQYILTVQGGDILDYKETRKLFLITYPLIKLIIKNAKKVHAVSKSVAHQILKFYPRVVKIIPNSINLKFFNKRPEKIINNIKNLLKIKNDEFILITTSRLVPKNNIEFVLKALKEINDKSIRFLIIGSGPLFKKLEKLIIQDNLNANLLGYIPNENIPDYLSIANIFIRISIEEGFGISFLEAMACNLPIIASNIGGIKDFIINNYNGILIDPRNKNELVEKILLLKNNQLLIKDLVNNAKKNLSKFDIENIISKIEKLYKN
ncbi:MAG: glycosyltransferase family 4 protein [Candidatus Helarchaeota archaeon]